MCSQQRSRGLGSHQDRATSRTKEKKRRLRKEKTSINNRPARELEGEARLGEKGEGRRGSEDNRGGKSRTNASQKPLVSPIAGWETKEGGRRRRGGNKIIR